MKKKYKLRIREKISSWNCFGYFGYGQGRAGVEYQKDELGNELVCHNICKKSEECHKQHCRNMDVRFPIVSNIVRHTLYEVKKVEKSEVSPVQAVVVAMTVAANRNEPEALKIKEGLKKFQVPVMTDHYMYGQLENLDNGLNKRDPRTPPSIMLIGNK